MSLNGNRAVKVPASRLKRDEENALFSQENFIYYNLLNECQNGLNNILVAENINKLEYDVLFSSHCLKYEKLFYEGMRAKKREKLYNDQIGEFSTNYFAHNHYHPYNPYLQKYNGAYLRTYQLFD